MKNGQVSKSDAFDISDSMAVCGIMDSATGGGGIGGGSVNWNGNNWALACDFRNGDFANAQVPVP